jgi:hypothetical protein
MDLMRLVDVLRKMGDWQCNLPPEFQITGFHNFQETGDEP